MRYRREVRLAYLGPLSKIRGCDSQGQRQFYGEPPHVRRTFFQQLFHTLSTMKPLPLLAISLLLLILQGCASRTVDPPTTPGTLPFYLEIPRNRPTGDMYVTSGVVNKVQSVIVNDSLTLRDIQSYSAQFTRDRGSVPMPAGVRLNGHDMTPHAASDTLRLRGTSETSLLGRNTWEIVDSAGATASFESPVIDVVDSVLPFRLLSSTQALRSDSSLTIRWMRPTRGSGGMYIEWQAPNDTLVYTATDGVGTFAIPADDMRRVRGKGRVILTRFLNSTGTFQGLRVVVSRLAQRIYEVTVQ